jgi:hypothetical protein
MGEEQQLEQAQARIQALETGRLRDAVALAGAEAGLIDLRDLDHLPLEGVIIQPDGTISGVKEMVEKLRGQKPHWFKQDNQSPNRDRASRQVPKLSTADSRIAALGIKPGSTEHKKLKAEYVQRHM